MPVLSIYGVNVYDKCGKTIVDGESVFIKLHSEGSVSVPAAVYGTTYPTYTWTPGVVTIDFTPVIGLPYITIVDAHSSQPATAYDLCHWGELQGVDANNQFYQMKIYNGSLSARTLRWRLWRFDY